MINDKNVYTHHSGKVDFKRRLKYIVKKKSVDKIPSICVSRKCSIMTSSSKAVYSAMTFR